MESLRGNKPLLYSIVFAFSLVLSLIFNLIPQLTEQFQIVIIPDDVSRRYALISYSFIISSRLDAIDCFLCCSW